MCGIPTEPPLARVHEELDKFDVQSIIFNQRHFDRIHFVFEIFNGRVTGRITIDGISHQLEEISGVYIRLMDDRLLPEVRREPPNSERRLHCRALHDALIHWCNIAPNRIVNRPVSMASNSSKPYQAQIISKLGFDIPETLITNEPALVRQFAERHGQIVFKSISGIRSMVDTLKEKDMWRLEAIRWCPVQFQEFIEGYNVRVHVIGGEAYAASIMTNAIDYRYAHRQGYGDAEMKPFVLTDELEDRCIRLCKTLDLFFGGIDLKITPNNRVYCFEVNPSPAYNYFEGGTGQPIARALARLLLGSENTQ